MQLDGVFSDAMEGMVKDRPVLLLWNRGLDQA